MQRTVADTVMDMKALRNKVEQSVVQADALESAMKEVNRGTQLSTSLKSKVESIERMFQRSGLGEPVVSCTRLYCSNFETSNGYSGLYSTNFGH